MRMLSLSIYIAAIVISCIAMVCGGISGFDLEYWVVVGCVLAAKISGELNDFGSG